MMIFEEMNEEANLSLSLFGWPAFILYSSPVVSLTFTVYLYSAFLPTLQLQMITHCNGTDARNTNKGNREDKAILFR